MGYSGASFYSHDQPLPIQRKDDRETNLLKMCKAITPPCWLNPLLFNGHLQTIWRTGKEDGPWIYYKRKLFSAEDPTFAGTFAVDFVVPPYEGSDSELHPRTTHFSEKELENLEGDDRKPMLVALHGLSGGSHEVYLRDALKPLVDAGWEACVVNSRGCCRSKITSGVLYTARVTWDLRQVVKYLRERFPNRPLFAIGFSLGGNILVNVRSKSRRQGQLSILIQGPMILISSFRHDTVSW